MSGRSAHVRKEKSKVKPMASKHPLISPAGSEGAPSLYGQFPGVPGSNGENINNFYPELDCTSPVQSDFNTIKTGSSGSAHGDDFKALPAGAYAHVQKPVIPVGFESRIGKSSFRAKLDATSESIRNNIAKKFAKTKKEEEGKSSPTASITVQPGSHEMESRGSSLQKINNFSELLGGDPHMKTPNTQQQIYSWIGSKVEPWVYSLRKDGDAWDSHGDTYVYFASRSDTTSPFRTPSMRVHSFLLEDSGSSVLRDLLERGRVQNFSNGHGHGNTDQIHYHIYLAPPPTLSAVDTLRHQIASRNLIALACKMKMVGFSFFQALTDLHERLEVSMMPDVDSAGRIIDWLRDLVGFDCRNNPVLTCAILAWSESAGVRWKEGWVEAFVHGVGMYNRMSALPEWRNVSHVTRAHMENKDLALYSIVTSCQERLTDFNFDDMWPDMSSTEPTSRTSFKRAQIFFLEYYKTTYQIWPPRDPNGEELWLTRKLVHNIQRDFGGLYDYLVNRDVVWECSEERSSRKWTLVHPNNSSFQADTPDLPFTDVLVAFDNRHRYPHIPHPYCLVPKFPQEAQSPFKSNVKNGSSKSAGKKPNVPQDKRKIAKAYNDSTNVFQLRPDFVHNNLIESFLAFEKNDQVDDLDLAAARRGRWVLIYGILQSLATLSVDTKGLAYKDGVRYHLCPPVSSEEGLPPWRGQVSNVEWARHDQSYCWKTVHSWVDELLQEQTAPPPTRRATGSGTTFVDSERPASSLRSHTASTLMSPTMRSIASHSQLGRSHNGGEHDGYNNYPPGIEKLNEWPIREQENDYGHGSEYGHGSRTGSEYGQGSENGQSRTTGSEYAQSRSAGSEYGYGRESVQGRRQPRSYNQDHSQHGSRDQSRDRLASNSPQEYASPVEQAKIPIRNRHQDAQARAMPSEEYANPIDNDRGFVPQEYVTSPVEQVRGQSRNRRSPAAGSPPPVPPNHPGYPPGQAPVHSGQQIYDMGQIDSRDRSQNRRQGLPQISPISPLQYPSDPSRNGRSTSGNHFGSDGASDESLEREREPLRTRRAPILPPLEYVTGDHGRGQVLHANRSQQRGPVVRQQDGQAYNF